MIKKFDKKNETKLIELKKEFIKLDDTKNGKLGKNKIIELMKKTKLEKILFEIYILIIDLKEDVEFTFEDFVNLISMSGNFNESEIRQLFEIFDEEKKNYISVENFRNISKEYKFDIDDVFIADILDKCDVNKDGKLCYEDLKKILSDI